MLLRGGVYMCVGLRGITMGVKAELRSGVIGHKRRFCVCVADWRIDKSIATEGESYWAAVAVRRFGWKGFK